MPQLGRILSHAFVGIENSAIAREPAQLLRLRQNGYELLIANNIGDGLQLFESYPVSAIVLEHIKRVQLHVPMLSEDIELPEGALVGVDVVAAKSDGARFLLTTIHSILVKKFAQSDQAGSPAAPLPKLQDPGASAEDSDDPPCIADDLSTDAKDAAFSSTVWQDIRDGNIQF